MIKRKELLRQVRSALKRSRAVALIGPRQCGKTTLARQLLSVDSPNYLDLEDPSSFARLDEPMTALRGLKGLVVIDEVQRRPDLFPVLRVLLDRTPLSARFLILGSASPELLRQTSESLAGRIETIAMSGFSMAEVGQVEVARHWLRGGFPPSYLARTESDSLAWRKNFIQTFLERDLPQWGIGTPAMRVAALLDHGGALPRPDLERGGTARALGRQRIHGAALSRYSVWRLHGPPATALACQFEEAAGQRRPKIYVRDTGLLHHLLGIRTEKELLGHPKCGSSWEGYVVEETIKATEPDEAYYWATHSGAEIDLVLVKSGRMLGVECKRMDAPRLTPSMRTALQDVKLEQIAVVYPGTKRYSLGERVAAVPLETVAEGLKGLFPKKQ